MREIWIDADGTAHEACRLLFYADGKFLGEAPFDPGNAPELGYRRGGVAYFCSHCGEVWGRVVLEHLDKGQLWFAQVDSVPCARHPSQWEVPGSFLGGYRNDALLAYMPEGVLQREFLVHLNQLMKE